MSPSNTRTRRNQLALVVATGLLVSFAVQCVLFARANAQTYDEGITLASGMWLLEGHHDGLNAEHPPMAKLLAALPVRLFTSARVDIAAWRASRESPFGLGREFLYASGVPYERLLWLGRLPSIALAGLAVALVGVWALRLWGIRGGLLALGLAAFDPNLVAYGSVIGHDAPLTFFSTAAFLSISEFLDTRRVAWVWLAGVASGLALSTKHSAPLVVGIESVALLANAWTSGVAAPNDEGGAPISRLGATMRGAGHVALLAGIALLVVRLVHHPAGYQPYFAGLRRQFAHQAGGHPAFLLGEISRRGWVSYLPIALAVKSPPLTLLLAAASLALTRRGTPFGAAWRSLVLPAFLLFLGLLAIRVDIGVRYALPLIPLVIVVGARVATLPLGRRGTWPLALGFVHHSVAALRIAPHDIAFFSDVIGGPENGHLYLADSNLDWGQDIGTLGRWLSTHERPKRLYLSYFGTALPEAYGVHYRPAPNSCPHGAPWPYLSNEPEEPTSGRDLLAISEMNLQGVFFKDAKAYAWLSRRTPVAVLGYSIRVYDITGDETAHEELSRQYEPLYPPSR